MASFFCWFWCVNISHNYIIMGRQHWKNATYTNISKYFALHTHTIRSTTWFQASNRCSEMKWKDYQLNGVWCGEVFNKINAINEDLRFDFDQFLTFLFRAMKTDAKNAGICSEWLALLPQYQNVMSESQKQSKTRQMYEKRVHFLLYIRYSRLYRLYIVLHLLFFYIALTKRWSWNSNKNKHVDEFEIRIRRT